ncbi:MAG: DnaA N-terminal domain-containing protein [Bryobacteraceae bacterium]
MTAAAAVVPGNGWPAPGPENGYCRVPHFVIERIWRVCPTPVEVGCVLCILDQTFGYGREYCDLAVGWIAEHLGVTERAVLGAIEGATARGFIRKQRAGRLNRFRVNLEALHNAPDFEHPRPEIITTPGEDSATRPPRARHIRKARVLLHGKQLKAYAENDLLIADIAAATVAVCGECKTVGVFEMVTESELSFVDGEETAKGELQFRCEPEKPQNPSASNSPLGEGTAKDEPQFRSAAPGPKAAPVEKPRKVQPIAASSGPSDERIKAVHRYLCTWREAFHDTPPTIGQARAVAAELGDAPIEYLDGVLKQRRRWIYERAEHYGAVKALARQARESFETDEGLPCPCGKSRLKAGQICSHCGPQPKQTTTTARRGPQAPWDQVKAALQLALEPAAYANWIEATYLVRAHDHHLHVAVPDEATLQFLDQEYGSQIATALAETAGPGYQVEYAIEASHG